MKIENPDTATASTGRLARIGATIFMLLAMALLTSSLLHAGTGHPVSGRSIVSVHTG